MYDKTDGYEFIELYIPSLHTPLEEQSLGQTIFPILSTTEITSESFFVWNISYFLICSKQYSFTDSIVYFENSADPLSYKNERLLNFEMKKIFMFL